MIWQTAHRSLDLTTHAVVMGIVNVTPDSFSDGGQFLDVRRAIDHGLSMISDGATIIDIGGESTRPGAAAVSAEEEKSRVLPVIEGLLRQASDCLISIDTSKASVARAALEAGAAIVNDVTALQGDDAMPAVVREARAGVILMHMQGTPRTMQQQPSYHDVLGEVRAFLAGRLRFASDHGIDPGCVALDPGIGFGKTVAHNLTLLRGMDALTIDERPLVLGVSRKSFLAKAAGVELVADRLWPTLALTALMLQKGARILRVHEVKPNVAALRMTEALLPNESAQS